MNKRKVIQTGEIEDTSNIHYLKCKFGDYNVIVKVNDKYLKILPNKPLMPIASFIEIYSLIANNKTLSPMLSDKEYMHNIFFY